MKRTLLFAMTLCGLLACSKEAPTEEFLSIEAGLPAQTSKTSLGTKTGSSWPLLWSEGDCLFLNGVSSSALTSAQAGGAMATFKFAGVGGATVWNYTYCGLEGSDCTVVFPSSQSSSTGNISGNSLPMYASTESVSGITLAPLGAVLRFSFTSSSAVTVTQIQIQTVAGEAISGNYAIGKNSAGRLNGSLSASGNNRDNVVIAAGVALSSSPKPFCAVVPAGTYEKGFQARITASTGKIMDVWFNTKSNKTLTAGTLYDFGESSFVPMGSSMMAVLSTEKFTVDTVSY
jgi:hypothetical protein